jgi:DNA repair protein RecO (recombination protein O)
MVQADIALILQCIKQGDSSAVVRMFTQKNGLLSFLIKGVYKKQQSKAALVQPMQFVHLNYRMHESKELLFASELKAYQVFQHIPFSPIKLAQLNFLAELLLKTLKPGVDDAPLFGHIVEVLNGLDNKEEDPNFHLRFLIGYAAHLGIGITFNYSSENQYFTFESGSFSSVKTADADAFISLGLATLVQTKVPLELPQNRVQRKEILHLLLDYFRYHYPSLNAFKSPEVLSAIFT